MSRPGNGNNEKTNLSKLQHNKHKLDINSIEKDDLDFPAERKREQFGRPSGSTEPSGTGVPSRGDPSLESLFVPAPRYCQARKANRLSEFFSRLRGICGEAGRIRSQTEAGDTTGWLVKDQEILPCWDRIRRYRISRRSVPTITVLGAQLRRRRNTQAPASITPNVARVAGSGVSTSKLNGPAGD